jgi:hypothetical protein
MSATDLMPKHETKENHDSPKDYKGHGTNIAGIIAVDMKTFVGVAPEATLDMIVRIVVSIKESFLLAKETVKAKLRLARMVRLYFFSFFPVVSAHPHH